MLSQSVKTLEAKPVRLEIGLSNLKGKEIAIANVSPRGEMEIL